MNRVWAGIVASTLRGVAALVPEAAGVQAQRGRALSALGRDSLA
ncbi:MAG: hypothetical protein ACI9WU_001021, partial [Myxococcota bacterium]